MKRRLTDYLPRSGDVTRALQKALASATLAVFGISGTSAATDAHVRVQTVPVPTILDRSKKTAKLILRLPGTVVNHAMMQHRSHSSHRSHASHRSHYSGTGGVAAPKPSPKTTETQPSASTAATGASNGMALADFGGLEFFNAVIEGVDRQSRSLRVRALNPENRFTIMLKDDTLIEPTIGARLRFDDYLDANAGRYPFEVGEKVQIAWRQNPVTKATTAAHIVRSK